MFGNDKLLRTIRLVDNIKIEIYQQGNRRKYALIWTSILTENNKNKPGTPYDEDFAPPYKTSKFDIADSDDTLIEAAINLYIENYGKSGGYKQSQRSYYKIIQDPFSDPFTARTYGSKTSPYYLNNGCVLTIEWIGTIPNPNYELGTFSSPGSAFLYNKSKGNSRWLYDQNITSPEDGIGDHITSKWVVPTGEVINNYRDRSDLQEKRVLITLPNDSNEDVNDDLIWTKNLIIESDKIGEAYNDYFKNKKDEDIIKLIIEQYKSQVISNLGINDYDLKLCMPDTEACSIIEYKSPIKANNNTVDKSVAEETPVTGTMSSTKVKFTIDGLGSEIKVKANTDLDIFTVWAGPIPKPKELTDEFENLGDLDIEYVEGGFKGAEEKLVEVESPSKMPEVSSSLNNVPDSSSVSTYTPDPNAKPGTVVSLPKDYSHTSEQGYNILNSQWIGDLIASAKSHIGHPTYDISGTEKGNLGCASAVSMMFYRAFGVHMRDGKPVKAKPTDIGSFGTKGTSEAAGWFENTSLYQKITWTDAQPGDIINTARNSSTDKAGHIGVVIDVKAKDGSWAIVSNSSKGFAGGGGGAVKQNYSVKAWQSVTDRNPSKTFAFRYIGPRLSPGQTA